MSDPFQAPQGFSMEDYSDIDPALVNELKEKILADEMIKRYKLEWEVFAWALPELRGGASVDDAIEVGRWEWDV